MTVTYGGQDFTVDTHVTPEEAFNTASQAYIPEPDSDPFTHGFHRQIVGLSAALATTNTPWDWHSEPRYHYDSGFGYRPPYGKTEYQSVVDTMEYTAKELTKLAQDKLVSRTGIFSTMDSSYHLTSRIDSVINGFQRAVEQLIDQSIKTKFPAVRRGSKRYKELQVCLLTKAQDMVKFQVVTEAEILLSQLEKHYVTRAQKFDQEAQQIEALRQRANHLEALRPDSPAFNPLRVATALLKTKIAEHKAVGTHEVSFYKDKIAKFQSESFVGWGWFSNP